MKKFVIVALMVCLMALVFTSIAYATPAKTNPGDPIPGKCLDCHAKKDGAEVSSSYHAMMGKGLTNEVNRPIGMYAGW